MSGDMQTFITTLTEGFSADAMWGSLAPMAPLLVVVGLFSLALYFTRRATKGAAKGKLRF